MMSFLRKEHGMRQGTGLVLLVLPALCASELRAHAQEPPDTIQTTVQDTAPRAGSDEPEELTEELTEGTREPEAAFALLWKGLIQGGFIGRSDVPGDEPAREFRLREAQVSVEGSPIPGTHFFIEANFPGPGEEVELNDAAVTLELAKSVRLVAGQLRVPLNRPAVSARAALFVAEPRAAGPLQRKARDRGVNLVLTPFDGRLLYEQALVNGNGILAGDLGNDDSDLLLQGRLVWFAGGDWPLPLPAQTDLEHSPWNTFLKFGWAAGDFERGVTETLSERVGEKTWNVGQAIVGKGLYTYWQYSQALAEGEWDFDSRSFSVTSGYAIPLGRFLPFLESAPAVVRKASLEPKVQYETLRFDDPTLLNRSNREVFRFGVNYYPLGIPHIRVMVDNEVVVRPQRSNTLLVFLHYMF
jgi:hypothetical protein